MKKDQKDFESENMSDLVELINSKNNSRRLLDVLRRNKKDKSKSKDKKWKSPVQNGLGFWMGSNKRAELFIKQTQLFRH